MSARTLKAKGFTLVEILIVVVILGILAAIVIPQFTSASEAARASSLVTQLQSLRSQLELYQLEHNGEYPDSDTEQFWRQLTTETNEDGGIPAADDRSFGPYLQKVVRNALNDETETATIEGIQTVVSTIEAQDDEQPLPLVGANLASSFLYNPNTGEIKAIISGEVADNVNFDVNDGDVVTDATP